MMCGSIFDVYLSVSNYMHRVIQISVVSSLLLAAFSSGAAGDPGGYRECGDAFTAVTLRSARAAADTVPDTLSAALPDTLRPADSVTVKPLSRSEIRQMRRDSVRHVRDSMATETHRILNTCAFPDTLFYRRILKWNSDSKVGNMTLIDNDTTLNEWYTENPIFKRDISATYLGMSGSAALSSNWFRRTEFDKFRAYEPWLYATFLPETMPMYNVKSTYTELGYWGTIFAFKDKEEANLKILHTQNITPELNLAFQWLTYGGKGLLNNEETHNKTLSVTGNYLGKHYVADFGFIHNNIYRDENGGVLNTREVRDTIIEPKALDTRLKGHNDYSRNTFFLHHHYSLPFRNVKQYFAERKERRMAAKAGSLPADTVALSDTLLPVQDGLSEITAWKDTIALDEGSQITFGHIAEISRFRRSYYDVITDSDLAAREMYGDRFYVHPTESHDSTRSFLVENRLFVRLQPWARDAIVSKVDAGIGHQFQNQYVFSPDMYLVGNYNDKFNNAFIYGGVSGKFRRYLDWNADVKYDFMGYSQNDLDVNAAMKYSFYPFKDRNTGVDFTARFTTSLKRPDYFTNYVCSNHYMWAHDFSKVSRTTIQAQLDIDRWDMELFFGYGMVSGQVYYDTLGMARQNSGLLNVISAYLKKDFVVWRRLHLDNQLLFQFSSDQDVLPTPLLTAHLRWYVEFPIVSEDVMRMQIGVDGTFNTSYYAPMWNPALGQFQAQKEEKTGGTAPYLDAFVNVQWKKVSLYVKVTNVAQGWPEGDYFSSFPYIRPVRQFKIGLFWPFYF